MKKYIKQLLTLLLFVILLIPNNVNAKDSVNIYLFYGDGCPHCRALEEKLEEIKIDYPNISVHYYETWYNKKSAKKLDEIEDLLDINIKGVPFTVIGGKTLSGYMEGITDVELIDSIEYYSEEENKCNDVVGNYLGVTVENKELKDCIKINEDKNFKIDIPFICKINTKDLSLPVISILFGTLDGFNPCAMWILLFLITMLLNLKPLPASSLI